METPDLSRIHCVLYAGVAMFRQISFIIACAVAVVLSAAVFASGQASFQGVGDLPGGETESLAYGISGDGSTVVGASKSASGQEAFRWKDGVISPLADLPGGASEGSESSAAAASYDGTVIVGSGRDDDGLWAVVWTNDQPAVLSGLPDATCGGAHDISSDGSIIVGWSDSILGEQAVLWQNNTVQPLDDLSTTAYTSRALAVSPNGQVVVGWRSIYWSFEAFHWAGGAMIGLGLPPQAFESQALGVSANGYTVGFSNNDTSEAVMWHDGTVASLGFLPGGSSASAVGVSADGRVIVGSGNTAVLSGGGVHLGCSSRHPVAEGGLSH